MKMSTNCVRSVSADADPAEVSDAHPLGAAAARAESAADCRNVLRVKSLGVVNVPPAPWMRQILASNDGRSSLTFTISSRNSQLPQANDDCVKRLGSFLSKRLVHVSGPRMGCLHHMHARANLRNVGTGQRRHDDPHGPDHVKRDVWFAELQFVRPVSLKWGTALPQATAS